MTPAHDDQLRPGFTVPGYRVLQLLGSGGSAQVWRAQVRATGQAVALKFIPTTASAAAQPLGGYASEAALLSRLQHPHLIRIHDVHQLAHGMVLVLDLASGGSLRELLVRRQRLTPGEVCTAVAPVGAAVAYAHGQGVTHGDVSTGNVLFTDTGVPLLADLGVARLLGDDRPVSSTAGYIDPLVARGSVPTPASDVFMLAATALHALTGSVLWSAATSEQALALAAAGEIGSLREKLRGCPPGLLKLIEQALSLDPAVRPSAAEFALEFRHGCVPAPVELDAGRAHVLADRSTVPVANGYDRPDFRAALHGADQSDQPADLSCDDDRAVLESRFLGAAEQFTHGVQLPPVLRPVRWHRRLRDATARPLRQHRRASVLFAVLLVVTLTGVLARSQVSAVMTGVRAHFQTSPVALTPTGATVSSGATVSVNTSASPNLLSATAAISSDTEAASVLAALDQLRERAFATDDPDLFGEIYGSAVLAHGDRALLAQLVPTGCTLAGVHTTYSQVHVVSSTQTVASVNVHAVLAASTLRCATGVTAAAPGQGSTALRISLARNGDAFQIVGQTLQ